MPREASDARAYLLNHMYPQYLTLLFKPRSTLSLQKHIKRGIDDWHFLTTVFYHLEESRRVQFSLASPPCYLPSPFSQRFNYSYYPLLLHRIPTHKNILYYVLLPPPPSSPTSPHPAAFITLSPPASTLPLPFLSNQSFVSYPIVPSLFLVYFPSLP